MRIYKFVIFKARQLFCLRSEPRPEFYFPSLAFRGGAADVPDAGTIGLVPAAGWFWSARKLIRIARHAQPAAQRQSCSTRYADGRFIVFPSAEAR
jgi:hypothetical protein